MVNFTTQLRPYHLGTQIYRESSKQVAGMHMFGQKWRKRLVQRVCYWRNLLGISADHKIDFAA